MILPRGCRFDLSRAGHIFLILNFMHFKISLYHFAYTLSLFLRGCDDSYVLESFGDNMAIYPLRDSPRYICRGLRAPFRLIMYQGRYRLLVLSAESIIKAIPRRWQMTRLFLWNDIIPESAEISHWPPSPPPPPPPSTASCKTPHCLCQRFLPTDVVTSPSKWPADQP